MLSVNDKALGQGENALGRGNLVKFKRTDWGWSIQAHQSFFDFKREYHR
jgi:hypothetical protein